MISNGNDEVPAFIPILYLHVLFLNCSTIYPGSDSQSIVPLTIFICERLYSWDIDTFKFKNCFLEKGKFLVSTFDVTSFQFSVEHGV